MEGGWRKGLPRGGRGNRYPGGPRVPLSARVQPEIRELAHRLAEDRQMTLGELLTELLEREAHSPSGLSMSSDGS